MAEKADKKVEKPKEEAHGAEGEAAPKKKGGLLTKMPVLVGAVMLLEAVALFGAVKFLGIGSPKAAQAEVSLKDKEGEGHGEDAGGDAAGKKDDAGGHGTGDAAKADAGGDAKKDDGGHGGGAAAGKDKADPNEKPLVNGEKEVAVVKFEAMNWQSGKPMTYRVEVAARVKAANLKKVELVLKGRKSTLEDRIRTIIAQSDPDKLSSASEPGLETLRRQIKHELEVLAGEGTIVEVLVPKCIGFN